METLETFATNSAILLGGLLVRFLIFAGLLALISIPILLAVYGWNGLCELVLRRRGEADAGGIRWRPGFAYAPSHAWIGAVLSYVLFPQVAKEFLAGRGKPPAGLSGDQLAAIAVAVGAK